MMEDYKPFGELSRDEKLALMTAWVDGEFIEWRAAGWKTWKFTTEPNWQLHHAYRIAPKPVVKPSLNWDHVAPEYVSLVVDEDGAGWLYTKPPRASGEGFIYQQGRGWGTAYAFTSFNPGSFVPNKNGIVENWQDSLVYRPGFEPEGETK